MNIELRFLEKAIKDRNYINFSYKDKKYQNIKASELKEMGFEFKLIQKLIILKNKF